MTVFTSCANDTQEPQKSPPENATKGPEVPSHRLYRDGSRERPHLAAPKIATDNVKRDDEPEAHIMRVKESKGKEPLMIINSIPDIETELSDYELALWLDKEQGRPSSRPHDSDIARIVDATSTEMTDAELAQLFSLEWNDDGDQMALDEQIKSDSELARQLAREFAGDAAGLDVSVNSDSEKDNAQQSGTRKKPRANSHSDEGSDGKADRPTKKKRKWSSKKRRPSARGAASSSSSITGKSKSGGGGRGISFFQKPKSESKSSTMKGEPKAGASSTVFVKSEAESRPVIKLNSVAPRIKSEPQHDSALRKVKKEHDK
ncbi:hypothetical protein SeMB42_g07513 [Synchytrium endobioticum]|uniref:Uncharacterized protein n=1 Tax=Synchytrium endobioticum TaxID=286115 RepID=A0A507C588_9FUNG|nr:hypothetical protein SeMB42_g07513 [Synchytrium endobioticum]TPX41788.1 hypothetical protein SeLEV6574_g05922 [Synchytrium endobioticum]